MSNETLVSKMAAVRGAISKALVAGESTTQFRKFLAELEADQQKANAAVAAQDAAQVAAKEAERQRIEHAAQSLVEARANRLNALVTKFSPTAISA